MSQGFAVCEEDGPLRVSARTPLMKRLGRLLYESLPRLLGGDEDTDSGFPVAGWAGCGRTRR